MAVTSRTKQLIVLIWVLMVLPGMYFTYQFFPPHFSGNWLEILAFLLLICVVASMPMIINNIPIFLIQWVSLAVFLRFGLFVEMIFAQLAVIVLLLKIRVPKDQIFRFPLNFTMFFFVSLGSGLVYHLLGGQTGVVLLKDTRSLWLAGLYALMNYTINQVIVSFNLYFVYKFKGSFFGKDFVVESITTFVIFPLGFVLYMLYDQAGPLALLFVGIPFVTLTVIFNLYYSSEKINSYLQKAAEIGHQMAELLHVNDVINLFIEKLSEMLPVDYAYILEVREGKLHVSRMIEEGRAVEVELETLRKHEGISGMVWANQRAVRYSSRKEWRDIITGYMPDKAESILCVPIIRSQKVMGVLLLASKRKRAYEKYQLVIVDILCTHFAVALENAKHYELTKMQSERCSLTNLYNYRYFERKLNEEFGKLFKFERKQLSLIILDIDHFKQVNDTFGHQSGNEILCEIANRLRKMVGSRGTVARYGGEEFVVLLPDLEKGDAFQLAEHIRQSVANWPFSLKQSLDPEKKQARITASIGVATSPEDAEDAHDLVRHADRALYVGAKRAGRNRVAEYSSC
jgi:diguanylate cyclase (GGDEF)-like protein